MSAPKTKIIKWDFRDVSSGLQKLRQFLLGRKYVLHNRFPPLIAPRSIPQPEIPRGPEYKYANQWYGNRSALYSVKPPVIAPLTVGLPKPKGSEPEKVTCDPKTTDTQTIQFPFPPTPGQAWWFDSHCYYKEVCRPPPRPAPPPPPPPTPARPPCGPLKPVAVEPPPPPEEPCVEVREDPCAEAPPCRLEPCKREVVEPPPPPPKPCDPCKPPDDTKKKDC